VRNIAAADERGPITLGGGLGAQISSTQLPYWSRINITSNGQTIFAGALMKRRESLSGNDVILEYWDDRWLLSKIPLRGALVRDSYDGLVKFVPGYDPHCNPGGYKNCTPSGGNSTGALPQGTFFCFTALAERATQTLNIDSSDGTEATAPGTAIWWTPAHWLSYLRAYALFVPPAYYQGDWATLDTTKLAWPDMTFQNSQMFNAMPDRNFRGKTVLGALCEGFDIAGDYELAVDYQGSTTILTHYARAKAVQAGAVVNRRTMDLQRGGDTTTNGDIKTIFDGDVEVDATELATGVIVEGARPRIESQFQYSATQIGGDCLSCAWTQTEQSGFLQIIKTGKDLTGNDIPGGNNGNLKNSPQALRFARMAFPKVFRALQADPGVSGQLDTIMAGAKATYNGVDYIKDYRPFHDEQLQCYFETAQPRRGRIRLPVRIQVSDSVDANTTFHDVTYNCGLRLESDGLIYFDGLSDDLQGIDNIYFGSLQNYTGVLDGQGNDTTLPFMRYIRLNIAVSHDTRTRQSQDVFSGTDPNGIGSEIDTSLAGPYGPALQHYVLAKDSYPQEHQVNSYPAGDGSFQTTDGGNPPALVTLKSPRNNLIIYDDLNQLKAHADRQQTDKARLKRTSHFKLPGIRLDFQVGDFLDTVRFRNAPGSYPIFSPVGNVRFRFKEQVTVVVPE